MLGKDGAFAPLLESILNAVLEGERHIIKKKNVKWTTAVTERCKSRSRLYWVR